MTKHSQHTDWHLGVDYRVWGDETRVMRIFTQQIRPTFIYLESDNLASALTQSSMSPGTSAVHRTFIGIRHYLFIAVREGNEERRVSRYPVSGLVTSP